MKYYRYQYENDDATNHKLVIFSTDGEKIVSGLDLDQATKICSVLNASAIRLEEAKVSEARYETIRKMSYMDFKDIYMNNLSSGKQFDHLVDLHGERG